VGSFFFFDLFFFSHLSFSSSCLISSILSEVWQFKFACFAQVQEISSVVYQQFCCGGGFSLCLFSGGLVSLAHPFLWGKVSDHSDGPLLSECCDGSLFVFNFASRLILGNAHCFRR
jgi:hypothetical protein